MLTQKLALEALLSLEEIKYTLSSNCRFHRYGNRSVRLLSNLLRGQNLPTIIKRSRGENGIPTVKGSEIYTNLYTPSLTDVRARDAFWENIALPLMSSQQTDSLIKPISVKEVWAAIKQLKSNKALGPDGLTNESCSETLYYYTLDHPLSPLFTWSAKKNTSNLLWTTKSVPQYLKGSGYIF